MGQECRSFPGTEAVGKVYDWSGLQSYYPYPRGLHPKDRRVLGGGSDLEHRKYRGPCQECPKNRFMSAPNDEGCSL